MRRSCSRPSSTSWRARGCGTTACSRSGSSCLIDLSDVRSLLKTFFVAFPHVLVCDVGSRASELLLLGSAEPLAVSWPAVQEIFSNDARKNSIRAVGLFDEGTLLASICLVRPKYSAWPARRRINTDDNSRVEFSSASTLDTDTTRRTAWRCVRRRAIRGRWWTVSQDQPTIGKVTAQMALAAVGCAMSPRTEFRPLPPLRLRRPPHRIRRSAMCSSPTRGPSAEPTRGNRRSRSSPDAQRR